MYVVVCLWIHYFLFWIQYIVRVTRRVLGKRAPTAACSRCLVGSSEVDRVARMQQRKKAHRAMAYSITVQQLAERATYRNGECFPSLDYSPSSYVSYVVRKSSNR